MDYRIPNKASVCRNCVHAWKRDHFDLSKYGSMGHSFKCTLIDAEDRVGGLYKRGDDTCELFSTNERNGMPDANPYHLGRGG